MKNRLADYLRDYLFTLVFLADLHLDGTPIQIDGHEVDFWEFCYFLLTPLTQADLIVFLGDTIDKLGAKKLYPKARAQLYVLYEVLEDLGVTRQAIFLRGNHDYDARYFTWRKHIWVPSDLQFHLLPYRDLRVFHGHNTGLEQFKGQKHLSDDDMTNWRESLSQRKDGKQQRQNSIRSEDILVMGHTHNLHGYCNRETKVLGVPPVRKLWESTPFSQKGWVGFFGFGTWDDAGDWLLAIENPTDPQDLQGLLD